MDNFLRFLTTVLLGALLFMSSLWCYDIFRLGGNILWLGATGLLMVMGSMAGAEAKGYLYMLSNGREIWAITEDMLSEIENTPTEGNG